MRMRVIRDYKYCPEVAKGALLVIGNFDALHLGHKHLIETAKGIAEREELKLNLMTFEPHPMLFLNPSIKHINIISLDDKIKVLEELGVDFLFLQKFDENFASKTPKKFIEQISQHLEIKFLVVGSNFFFGFKKEGNIELLEKISQDYDFSLVSIPILNLETGQKISSSAVRDYLMRGDITNASRILGYNYFISGEVISGKQVGRKIGFPTVNIDFGDLLVPKFGVYTASIYIKNDECRYFGVANLGARPSFDKHDPSLEMHIFDFDKDILGKNVKIMLHEYIREQKKFSSLENIASQIYKDKIKAQQYFDSMYV
jgi:riboflavin kinase/FMN adenylyltransferase